METWEYKTASISAETNWQTGLGMKEPELPNEELETLLNKWGEAGWECFSLVPDEWRGDITGYTVTTYRAAFRRRKA